MLYELAIEAERKLYPAEPRNITALQRWLDEDAGKLLAMQPQIEQTVRNLRARAQQAPPAEIERNRTSHPKFAELRRQTAKLASLARAQAIRTRSQELTLPSLTAEEQAMTPSQLEDLAWPRVCPDEGKRIWGEEARALVLAQFALEKAKDLPVAERASLSDTLAWAWLANGRDEDALTQSEASLALASDDETDAYEEQLALLRAQRQASSDQAGAKALAGLRATIAALEAQVSTGSFQFEEASQEFLHTSLSRLLVMLQSLDANEHAAVAERRRWAQCIETLTRGHPKARATWEQARDAVAKADGVVASELYKSHPIDLPPQMGLVPIGMNPVTKLWEFYELRSAWDGTADPAAIEIPRHVMDGERAGQIEVKGDTGIVLVLLPGGELTMGSQGEDPSQPNYDPQRADGEALHEVELSPFFLARHELTMGQWKRLSGGEAPSYYPAGSTTGGGPRITWSNPVEQVDWPMCDTILSRHAMVLPTEAQWEYGCRAGTTTPWCCELGKLSYFANLADATAKLVVPAWTCEAWSDGHVAHAAVGRLLPNAFGLFDVHGNVWEWTRDSYLGPNAQPRPGDGWRGSPPGYSDRVARGGAFDCPASTARSALRIWVSPSFRGGALGLRAARLLLP